MSFVIRNRSWTGQGRGRTDRPGPPRLTRPLGPPLTAHPAGATLAAWATPDGLSLGATSEGATHEVRPLHRQPRRPDRRPGLQPAKAAGFDGLDLTLRPGGHVRPEAAEAGLAEARRAADAAGVAIPMVSTALTDVDSPHAEADLRRRRPLRRQAAQARLLGVPPLRHARRPDRAGPRQAPPRGRARAEVPRAALRPLPLRAVPRRGRPPALPGAAGLRAGGGRRLRRPDAHGDRGRPRGVGDGPGPRGPLARPGRRQELPLGPGRTATAAASGGGGGSTARWPTARPRCRSSSTT